MARQLTTRAQVNGYRFLLKRIEHALVRRDVRMLHDPMRSQVRALAVGTVLAVLALAGFGVWGLIKPQGSVGDSTVLVSKDGGGMYVLLDGTLHPVLNLASARLIMGGAQKPSSVSDSKLSKYPRGPLLGIPGAPGSLTGSAHPGTSTWTVCDSTSASSDATRVTVIGDRPHTSGSISPAGADAATLVTDGDDTYLVYQLARNGGRAAVRARVDTRSAAVMRALGLDGADPRPISSGLLNAIPEVAALSTPTIAGMDGRGALTDPGLHVGSVIKSTGVDNADKYYVVLRSGVQQVSRPTAELLRLSDKDGAAPVQTVAPGRIATLPTATDLPVSDFPQRHPVLTDPATTTTMCQAWSRGGDDPRASTTLLLGRSLPLPNGVKPVRVTTADGPGPGVDQVYVRPGSGEYLQVTGNEADSTRAESLFYVSDSGVRFGVADSKTGEMLGLGSAPGRAPAAVVSLLTGGPTLSRHNALVAHDGVAPDFHGQAVPAPGN